MKAGQGQLEDKEQLLGKRGPAGPIPQPTSQGSPAGIVEWSLASSLHRSAPCRPWPWGARCPCLGLAGSVLQPWAEPTASSAPQL